MTDAPEMERGIARVVTTAPPAPGFAGPVHTAVAVLDPSDFDGRTRILQLWFTIPASARWSEPRIDTTTRDSAAERHEAGVAARVYGEGSTSGIREGRVPVLIADVAIDPGARFEQELPASYNGFVYVLTGAVRAVGGAELRAGQVGWLDRPASDGASVLRLEGADGDRARIVVYAGEPQHRPIVTHGPFVGETRADLMRVSREYMEGRFPRVSELTREARSAAHES